VNIEPWRLMMVTSQTGATSAPWQAADGPRQAHHGRHIDGSTAPVEKIRSGAAVCAAAGPEPRP